MWELKDKKDIKDWDGFITEYSWYYNNETKMHVMIYGDSDLYTPENTDPDFETEDAKEAEDWFLNYENEDEDEELEVEIEEDLDIEEDESLKETLDTTKIQQFIKDVNYGKIYRGAHYRGGPIPSALPGYINQVNIPDNMRLKYIEASDLEDNSVELYYETQEPFTSQDADIFCEEVKKMLYTKAIPNLRVVLIVKARDGKDFGYCLMDYSFDENGKALTEDLSNKETLKESWYDNLDSTNKHADSYKVDALNVNPKFAQLIVDCLEEYINENPTEGIITNAQLDKYAKKLGIDKMAAGEELSKIWRDVRDVASYYAFGQSDFERSKKLLDAQSAFSEVVNNVARKYRKNNLEQIKTDALNEIDNVIKDPKNIGEDSEGVSYLTTNAFNKIRQIAINANLTQKELEDHNNYFFGSFGYKITK